MTRRGDDDPLKRRPERHSGRKPVLGEIPCIPVPPPPPPPLQPTISAPVIPPNVARAGGQLSFAEEHQLRQLVGEIARRRMEGLKLYEALPVQDAFHKSGASERLVIGSNRGGKTLPVAVEIARAVTGQDPYGKWPKANGRFIIVGFDGKHIAEVMYRKLFRAGAYKVIRDKGTKDWRAFRPWDANDRAREAECKPAPPLIPNRWIREIAWFNKKLNQPTTIRLTTGWELYFFSGEAQPPQGWDVDGVWFDEEIGNREWYVEMAARLVDRNGRFLWSATPQAGTEQLYELHYRSTQGDASVKEFFMLLADNPHLTAKQKEDLKKKWTSPDDIRVRIDGEFAISGYKVYPEFDMGIHGCDPFEIGSDWMNVMVVDPGRQVCAVLFAGVPPVGDKRAGHVYLWAELYLRNSDATMFGDAVKNVALGHSFRIFLIDGHAARMSEMGSGMTVQSQYAAALLKHNVRSELTGNNFLWGADEVKAGIMKFRDWLRIREDGTPKLQVFRGRLPNLVEVEMQRYAYKKTKIAGGVVIGEEPWKKHDHLQDCLRYLAMYDPVYTRPRAPKPRQSDAVLALKAKRERKRQKEGRQRVHLGPGKGKVGPWA